MQSSLQVVASTRKFAKKRSLVLHPLRRNFLSFFELQQFLGLS